MGDYKQFNAAPVLEQVEELLAQNRRFLIREVCDRCSIFDWWSDWLTPSHLKTMRTFLREAIKLGYEGYVCFKVGVTGCANGMWASIKESEDGYSPRDCAVLYRSFTPAYTYWDISDAEGEFDWPGKYKEGESHRTHYDNIKTIKQLEAFIDAHRDVVYRK